MYELLPLHVSRDEIWHFKHHFVLAVNRMVTRPDFWREKNNNKAETFFRLTFYVYSYVDSRERARARDEKQRRRISLGEKHDNFIAR